MGKISSSGSIGLGYPVILVAKCLEPKYWTSFSSERDDYLINCDRPTTAISFFIHSVERFAFSKLYFAMLYHCYFNTYVSLQKS